MPGLNMTQREDIRKLMAAGILDERLCEEIKKKVLWSGEWNYEKNVELCEELTLNGYIKSAEELRKLINL